MYLHIPNKKKEEEKRIDEEEIQKRYQIIKNILQKDGL